MAGILRYSRTSFADVFRSPLSRLNWRRLDAEHVNSDVGKHCPMDPETALAVVLDAAQRGNTKAARALGHVYQHGLGVPQDLQEAEYWLRMAAERGDAEALIALERLLQPTRAESPETLSGPRERVVTPPQPDDWPLVEVQVACTPGGIPEHLQTGIACFVAILPDSRQVRSRTFFLADEDGALPGGIAEKPGRWGCLLDMTAGLAAEAWQPAGKGQHWYSLRFELVPADCPGPSVSENTQPA
jgi:TPR repeat protein